LSFITLQREHDDKGEDNFVNYLAALSTIVSQLPRENAHVLYVLFEFLADCAAHEAATKMGARNLAVRPPPCPSPSFLLRLITQPCCSLYPFAVHRSVGLCSQHHSAAKGDDGDVARHPAAYSTGPHVHRVLQGHLEVGRTRRLGL